ncbi:MAG: family 20 glycosylhydrolase [Bacteroidota bacterium]
MKYFLPVLFLPLMFCSTPEKTSKPESYGFDFAVTAVDYNAQTTSVRLEISNQTEQALDGSDWAIYFSQFATGPVEAEIGSGLRLSRVLGDLWKIEPTAFDGLPAGSSLTVDWQQSGMMAHQYQLPVGVYIVIGGVAMDMQATISPIDPALISEQYRPTARSRWEENAVIQDRDLQALSAIFPTPKSQRREDSEVVLSTVVYCAPESLNETMAVFGDWLEEEVGITSFEPGEACNLQVALDTSLEVEAYTLTVSDDRVSVVGGSRAGVFYGLMSVLSSASVEDFASKSGELHLPQMEVEDQPAFAYRGFHLDVSRNFQKPETVKKLLRIMAFYKLNKLHFHLTDDEGWRLEIPELPELTQIGARRGHSPDELDHILPAYGSGHDPDSPENHGSGFYTQADYIDIIQYAQSLNILVIPEIDLPGHARAAIKSIESRLAATGDGAYRLMEPGDTSQYVSAQIYSDNVINVCQESTYDFVELVVDNLVKLYQAADVPLEIVHIGCDEVPAGAWVASANCSELATGDSRAEISNGLLGYFVSRVNAMLKSKGLRTAGWEEVVSTAEGQAPDRSIVPYVWHNEELAYGLANAGHDVVLCNAANLYFDLAYNRDPSEAGLNWAGFVDTESAFSFSPYHIGQSFSLDKATADQSILTSGGKQNIMGIQGQLWSETVRGAKTLEYYVMPKMFGLAERAWTGDPEWQDEESRNQDWSDFVHRLGRKELPLLDQLFGGWNYRVPLPGLKVEDSKVSANVRFPGLSIYYTTDGSDPDLESTKYNTPIPYDPSLRFRVISDATHMSRIVPVP